MSVKISNLKNQIERFSSNLGNLSDQEAINAIGSYLLYWFPVALQAEELVTYIKPDECVNFCVIKWNLQAEKYMNYIPDLSFLKFPIENYLKKTINNFIQFKNIYNNYWVEHITEKSTYMARSRPRIFVDKQNWTTDSQFVFQDNDNLVNAFYVRAIIDDGRRKTNIEIREATENTSSVLEEGYTLALNFEDNTVIVSYTGAIKDVKITLETIYHTEPLILATPDNKVFISRHNFCDNHFRYNAIIKVLLNPRLPFSIDDSLESYLINYLDLIASGTAYIIELYRDGIEPSQTSENYQKMLATFNVKSDQKDQFNKVNNFYKSRFSTNVNNSMNDFWRGGYINGF